ncbi:MAG: GNAT family N-acetyltransferase [Chloroflexi bacterium]|nr:GNAT family N-acetyltransferase [Chloroflexota bacterium]
MPSLVELRPVTRDDVNRIAEWLTDPEVSEAWFGRYTYGDPAHLGYEPNKMIDADEEAWNLIFHDPHHEPHRDIFSIYTLSGEHIGEGQLSIDEPLGDAQISILIGQKSLWHHGYGTSAAIAMIEHIFEHLGLHRAWVDVPEYNTAARAMFEHIGFQHEGPLRQSRPHDGARHNSVILGMLAEEYTAAFPDGVLSHVTTWDSPKV